MRCIHVVMFAAANRGTACSAKARAISSRLPVGTSEPEVYYTEATACGKSYVHDHRGVVRPLVNDAGWPASGGGRIRSESFFSKDPKKGLHRPRELGKIFA